MLFGAPSNRVKGGKQAADLKLLDLRVGMIKYLKQNEETGKYYYKIDIRKEHLKIAPANLPNEKDLEGLLRKVVVVACNLPAEEFAHVETNVKIMGAVSEDVVEVLEPPKNCKLGDRVFSNGYIQENHWMIKQKIFDMISPDLRVDSYGIAFYKDLPLQVKGRKGYVSVRTLCDCPITNI